MSSGENRSVSKGGDEQDSGSELIKLSELLGASKVVTGSPNIDESRQKDSEQEIKERETDRAGKEKYFKLRDRWSLYILIFVSFMLTFQAVLVFFVGFGIVDFSLYKKFLYLVIGENFAQIIGMGYIVAKYLFPNSKR